LTGLGFRLLHRRAAAIFHLRSHCRSPRLIQDAPTIVARREVLA
jgi:hypothetical protein